MKSKNKKTKKYVDRPRFALIYKIEQPAVRSYHSNVSRQLITKLGLSMKQMLKII